MSETQPKFTELDRDAQIRCVVDSALQRRAGGEEISDDDLYAAYPSLLPELATELRKLRVIARAREQSQQLGLGPIESAGDETAAYLPAQSYPSA